MGIQRTADERGLGQGGQQAQQAGEQPVAMHGRVPVEAAIESRMQLAGAPSVGGVQQNVARVGRVFPGDAVQRDAGELRSQFNGEGRRRLDHSDTGFPQVSYSLEYQAYECEKVRHNDRSE